MPEKNILFVMDGMKVGGVERALISVFHYFDYSSYNCELLLLHNDDELLNEVDKRVKITRLSSANNRKKPLSFFFWYLIIKLCFFSTKLKSKFSIRMQNACMKAYGKQILGKYDVVIAYKQGEAENFVADCIDCDRKILFYHHGSLIDENLHTRVIKKFDKVVAVSEGVRELLQENYPFIADKLTVIENYFDSDYIIKRSKEYSVQTEADVLKICTVGRFCKEKRFDRALECAKILKDKGVKFVWYLIGGGELYDDIYKACKENDLTDCVKFTGSKSNPLPYVASCDIYVQTSDAESYGLAMIEALVLNKPVVSTPTIGGKLLKAFGLNIYITENNISSLVKSFFSDKEKIDFKSNEFFVKKDAEVSNLWLSLIG